MLGRVVAGTRNRLEQTRFQNTATATCTSGSRALVSCFFRRLATGYASRSPRRTAGATAGPDQDPWLSLFFYAAECAGLMWREAHSKLVGYAAGSDCAACRSSALGIRGDSGMRRELRWPVKYDQSHWCCTRSRFCGCEADSTETNPTTSQVKRRPVRNEPLSKTA